MTQDGSTVVYSGSKIQPVCFQYWRVKLILGKSIKLYLKRGT